MKKLKVFKPFVSWGAVWNVVKVLRSGQLAEGPMVKRFEEEFAKFFSLDPAHCVALNSGTAALELAYELAGVARGDEVIAPVMTMVATSLPAVRRGADIVFADINKRFLMDPADVARRMTQKTKAIAYVDFGGLSETLDPICALAKERGIPVIQDSAQSVGPRFRPRGDYVCVSFQAVKTLTCGDGGMLISTDVSQAAKARRLRWFGIDRAMKQQQGDSEITEAGFKYHMNDVAASIGLGNLSSLNSISDRRAKIKKVYEASGLPIMVYPWLAMLVHEQALGLMRYLKTRGIETGQHHFRNDKYAVFGGRRTDLPVMDALEHSYILLPFHQDIAVRDAKRVVAEIQHFFSSVR